MSKQRISELEQDLQLVLDELDVFQSKVEVSHDSAQANAKLEEDLKKILLNLDSFQKKVEDADEDDIGALKGMLSELQDKLMLGEEIDGGNSSTASAAKKKGATPEAHLELYTHTRARKGTHDLPQAILLQNFIEQKQQNESKNWFHGLLFRQDKIESRRAGLFPIEKEALKENIESTPGILKASNAKLKETIVRLEVSITQMEVSCRGEINAHQEVIQKLQRKNVRLKDEIHALKQKQEENENRFEDMTAYEDIINQLQKENVQLHYKVEFLSSSQSDDPLGDPPGYLSSSLEDSYYESPSSREMTNRISSTENTDGIPSIPFIYDGCKREEYKRDVKHSIHI